MHPSETEAATSQLVDTTSMVIGAERAIPDDDRQGGPVRLPAVR
jgi:hypothetical protein